MRDRVTTTRPSTLSQTELNILLVVAQKSGKLDKPNLFAEFAIQKPVTSKSISSELGTSEQNISAGLKRLLDFVPAMVSREAAKMSQSIYSYTPTDDGIALLKTHGMLPTQEPKDNLDSDHSIAPR